MRALCVLLPACESQNIESLLDGYVNLVRFGAVSNAVLAPRSQSRDLLTVLHSVAETHFANVQSSASAATPLCLVLGTCARRPATVRQTRTRGSLCSSRRGDGHRHQGIRCCVRAVRGVRLVHRWLVSNGCCDAVARLVAKMESYLLPCCTSDDTDVRVAALGCVAEVRIATPCSRCGWYSSLPCVRAVR